MSPFKNMASIIKTTTKCDCNFYFCFGMNMETLFLKRLNIKLKTTYWMILVIVYAFVNKLTKKES